MAILEPPDEDRPPVKAEILTIDVSTIITIIIKETKMKIPLEPSAP
jgi:hypothetical protein